MTDNVVKAGIEDVLSSVKRLVSEEGRKVPDLVSKRKPSRLVLTDALRVTDPAKVENGPTSSKNSSASEADHSAKPMLLRACDIVQSGKKEETAGTQVENAAEDTAVSDDLAGSLSAKIEALEAAIARTEDQWEPDGDSADEYSGTPIKPLNWDAAEGFAAEARASIEREEVAEIEEAAFAATFVRAAAQAGQSDDAVAMDIQQGGASIPTMDEDALRALVADVVRQELQGALGERITRNIRKMVRREIHRALSAQNLD